MNRIKCYIFIFSLFFTASSMLSCAPQNDSRPSSTTTTTATAKDPLAHLKHPCVIPEGYVYPKGTAQYYIDNGIWLSDEFERPDIIWGGPGIIDMSVPRPGTVRYTTLAEFIPLSYPNTLRAFTLHFYSETEESANDKLIAYLTGEGFELLGTDAITKWPIFAGTGRAIDSLDCTAIQNAIGCSTEYGIDVGFRSQTYHTHSEPPPKGKYWSCGYSEIYVVPQE